MRMIHEGKFLKKLQDHGSHHADEGTQRRRNAKHMSLAILADRAGASVTALLTTDSRSMEWRAAGHGRLKQKLRVQRAWKPGY